MNKIIVSGNLASDVRVNKINDTTEVINGTLMVDDSYTKDGQRVDRSIPYSFAYFRDLGKAEKLANLLTKGRTITVEGSLNKQEASAPSTKDGKIYHDLQIRVEDIVLGRKPHAQEAAEIAARANAA